MGLTCLMGLSELVSVAGILPLLSVLAQPELLETNWALRAFTEFFGLETFQQATFGLGTAVLLVVVIGMTIRALVTYAQIRFAMGRGYSLASRLLKIYLSHDYSWYLSRNTAALSQSLLSEVDTVVRESVLTSVLLISNTFIIVLIGGFLFIIEPVVAITAIGLLGGVYVLAFTALRKRIVEIGKRRMAANGLRFKVAQEVTGSLKEIKVLGLERTSLDRFRRPARDMARQQTLGLVLQRLPRFALEAMVYGGFVVMVLVLIVMRGRDIADLLPLLGLLAVSAIKLFPAAQQIYMQLSALRLSFPALSRLHEQMRAGDGNPALPIKDGDTLPITQSVRLQDVHYSYPSGDRTVLSGFDLEIPAFTTVGLVGGTGAGKTTIVDLLLGLLTPGAGTLYVDDTALTPENMRTWQRNIGYVPQSIFLSDDTVAANIAFGLPTEDIDMERVRHAAGLANLHSFIESDLPDGYDTMVGERGLRLSGGQRQRIGIARALYTNPDVLVLDEATSALDTLTEKAVMEAMTTLGGQKTIIMIAHRLSTVRDCDKIVLLERGVVQDEGTYDDLVARNETFARMVKG